MKSTIEISFFLQLHIVGRQLGLRLDFRPLFFSGLRNTCEKSIGDRPVALMESTRKDSSFQPGGKCGIIPVGWGELMT